MNLSDLVGGVIALLLACTSSGPCSGPRTSEPCRTSWA
jgi:hypothetical protein